MKFITLTPCSHCGELKLPHVVCNSCGYYKKGKLCTNQEKTRPLNFDHYHVSNSKLSKHLKTRLLIGLDVLGGDFSPTIPVVCIQAPLFCFKSIKFS